MDESIKIYFNKDGWALSEKKSYASKTFTFDNFKLALSWMVEVGIEAECLNHHPNWKNVYNKVTITLTTHDVGGISELDYDMAIFAEKYFKNHS